mmetsp:Transcript_23642/g.47713  ORF Transcript_23642/g.47713 Transcript_23642/m.47713 type:complete len:211 (-) Transcript_23642:3-635(-)
MMNLILIIALILALSVAAQDHQQELEQQQQQQQQSQQGQQEEQPQQTLTLTREYIDSLLQVLTPACRMEMEGALASQTEVSHECKMEIQQVMQRFQSDPDAPKLPDQQQMPPTDADGNVIPPTSGKAARAAKRAAAAAAEAGTSAGTGGEVKPGTSPLVPIFLFVLALFGMGAALVMYVNAERKKAGTSFVRPKKLSKKKEEKMRQKGGK